MLRRSFTLCAAAGLVGLFFVGSASAMDFRVIHWNATGICQIYDFSWGGPPLPSNYHIVTPPLRSFTAALKAKDRLMRRGVCSI